MCSVTSDAGCLLAFHLFSVLAVLAVGWLPATISLLIVITTKLAYHSLSAHLANGLVLDSKVFSDEGSYVNK